MTFLPFVGNGGSEPLVVTPFCFSVKDDENLSWALIGDVGSKIEHLAEKFLPVCHPQL